MRELFKRWNRQSKQLDDCSDNQTENLASKKDDLGSKVNDRWSRLWEKLSGLPASGELEGYKDCNIQNIKM